MAKIIEYHYLKFNIGDGEFVMYAPITLDTEEIKLIEECVPIWFRGLKSRTSELAARTSDTQG